MASFNYNTDIMDVNPEDPPGGGGGGGYYPPATYGTIVMEMPFYKSDANSALDITIYLNCYNPDDLKFSGYISIDDVLVNTGTTNETFDNNNSKGQGTMTVPAIVEGVPAGSHVLRCRVKNRSPNYALQILPGSLVKLYELYQAAR